jgi:acetyl-CoA acyltransferase
MSKVNVNGGAIALGHPRGGSVTPLRAPLANARERPGGRSGLAPMWAGGGLATATITARLY